MRLHIDTDFAGDPDDACALAMVVGWPGVELVGVTTTADPDGRRAGYVKAFLRLLGVRNVPVVAGAGSSLAGRPMGGLADHARFWGRYVAVPSATGPLDPNEALSLIEQSVAAGATMAAIGPYTNLAAVHRSRPSALSGARVVTMGGWVFAPPDGYPAWGPERDWNAACDVAAAVDLLDSEADLTFVPCAAAAAAQLRAADLGRLRATGVVGELLAHQSLARGADSGYAAIGGAHRALADDLVNFHWDPVTCAVAVGWPGAVLETMRLRPVLEAGAIRFERHPRGRRTSVVTAVDGTGFSNTWLECVARAQSA